MKTYNQLPLDPGYVFDQLVAQVATNLASDSTLSIPRVKYYCETWKELQERLLVESKAESLKNEIFPLVALIRNFDRKYKSDDDRFDSSLTVIIVTKSTATMLSEDRIANNYIPVLRPIEEELFSVIKTSPYFARYRDLKPSHTSVESFNLGASDGKNYKLPSENLDGIIIENLDLKFNTPMMNMLRNGPTKALSYINNVAQLTAQYTGGLFRVGLSEVNYIGLGVPEYTIYTSHDSISSSITVGGSKVINVSGYTGEYYGQIQCEDGYTTSVLYFFYKVVDGIITKYTAYNEFKLQNFTLTGFTAPYYPFEILTQTTCNKSIINKVVIKTGVGVDPIEFDILETVPYTPATADTTDNTYTETLVSITNYRCVQLTVSLDTDNNTTTDQVSVSYFKLT